MDLKRILLCTDMDRTIIPNGSQPEHAEARRCFRAFCQQPEVCLVYVTGRHLALAEQAINDYALPYPDYAITDVGSKIYSCIDGRAREMSSWESLIAVDWRGQSNDQLKQAFRGIDELTMQEEEKQNRFKLSYYLDLTIDKDPIIAEMAAILDDLDIHASLTWSVDEPGATGLLDVLPLNATKLHSLRFLQRQLGYNTKELVFAGDSGNDLPVLGSDINAVLVANASEEVKTQAQKLASQEGHMTSLYLARNDSFLLGGNYAAGVLQGVWHFQPEFRTRLTSIGFST